MAVLRQSLKGRIAQWLGAGVLAACMFSSTNCASLNKHVVVPMEDLFAGRAAKAEYMLDGLVGNTEADVSSNYLPPVPYPYFKYTY